MSKIKITPFLYDQIKKQYLEALAARREEIYNQFKKGKSQQWIADFWGVDIALVNRSVKKSEKGKVERPA